MFTSKYIIAPGKVVEQTGVPVPSEWAGNIPQLAARLQGERAGLSRTYLTRPQDPQDGPGKQRAGAHIS